MKCCLDHLSHIIASGKSFAVGSTMRIERSSNLPDYDSTDGFPPLRRVDIHEYCRLFGKSTNQILLMNFSGQQFFLFYYSVVYLIMLFLCVVCRVGFIFHGINELMVKL